jgi:hypothetical protein
MAAAKPRASRALTPRLLKAGDAVRMSSRNRQYTKRRRDGGLCEPVDQSSVVKLKASETDGFSRRAEKAVDSLPSAVEYGAAPRIGRMVGALWANGGPANLFGSFLSLPSTGGPRESAR